MRLLRLLAALALLAASLAVAAPAAAGNPCYHGFSVPPLTDGPDTQVRMMPCAFAPTVVRVTPGTTVTWPNGQFPHLLTGANQEWGSPDEEISAGQTVAYRFDRPGSYPYACVLHPGMVGAGVVGDGVSVAAPSGAPPAVVAVATRVAVADSPTPTAAAAAVIAPAPRASAPAALPAEAAPASTRSADQGLLVLLGAAVAAIVGIRGFVARRARSRTTPTAPAG